MKPALGKMCPSCGERYEPGVLFCPLDGTPLSSSRTVSDPSLGESEDPYLELELQGKIRLTSLVGIGSMGRVYRAFQSGVDRDVAVKVLHRELTRNRELVARFHREAKIASRLVHPNVVQVLMTGALEGPPGSTIGGELYLVMEYLDGISLMSALAAAGASDGDALPLARALHIVLQLCAAVGEAHSQGVVHRDVKPENIMLVRRGEDPDFVKVLDFGIARQDFAEPGSTQAGLIFGTAKYISPEGAEGRRVGPPADVYSIATIFYQCLAGRTPFEGDAPMTLLMHQAQTPAPDLRSIARASYVPDPIADVIMNNLSKDPADRAEDARALRKELLTAARASGLALESLMGQASLKLDSKQRTRAHNLSEDVSRALKQLTPEPRASRPSLTSAPDSDPDRISIAPRASRPSGIPSGRPSSPTTRVSAGDDWGTDSAEPGTDTIPGMSKVPGADILSRGPSHRPGPTMPGFPIDESESTEQGDRHIDDRDGERVPTIQGHMVPVDGPPRSVGPISSDLAGRARRRSRASWIAIIALLVLVVPVLAIGAVKLLGPATSAEARSKDQLFEAAREAMRNHAWDAPSGANVKELTDDALTRVPDDRRFRSLRSEAAERVVADALGRKYAGAPADALRLAKLATELDPSLVAAQKLAEELASSVDAITPGAAPQTSAAKVPDKPVTSAPPWHPRPGISAEPSAMPRASASHEPSSKPPPGGSAALPQTLPPLPDDLPPPSGSARPWL
jgi:serine/threonine protein kinase